MIFKNLKTILAVAICFSILTPNTFASNDEESTDYSVTFALSEEEIKENIVESRNSIMSKKTGSMRIPEYSTYKYVEKPAVYKTIKGWANGSPEGGVRNEYGGIFYWEPEGNINESVSLGISYAGVSVSLSYGSVTSKATIFFTNVPAGGFYRLCAEPTYKIIPTEVYGKSISTGQYEYLYTIAPKSFFDVNLVPKKVRD